MMLLQDGKFSQAKAIRITMSRFITIIMAVMVLGFSASIASALIYSFQETTETHCRPKVANYLPSISAAIAVPPSSYIWRFVINLCAGQRLFLVAFHYTLYSNVATSVHYYPLLCQICFLCELIENLALIGLTCVSSSENFPVHENMFIAFQICSMVFMLLMCAVHKMAISSGRHATYKEQRNLKWQYVYCAINISSFFIAIYFYFRHERYCEPGVYTVFAFFEYIIVLSNIAFHHKVTFHFRERELVLGGRIYDN